MKIKHLFIIFIGFFILSCSSEKKEDNSKNEEKIEKRSIKQSIKDAKAHLQYTVKNHDDTLKFPRTLNKNGELVTTKAKNWTSGFFSGNLWYMFELTGNDKWKKYAKKWTSGLKSQKNNTGTHDLGFMMYCSFGNGYRLTKNSKYKDIIINSAKSLATRYNDTCKVIKSWDWSEKWQYPVIIDNMMNLELLFKATEFTGDSTFYKIADQHATTTMKQHYRDDYSSYHVVDYDTVTGEAIWKGTHQGYADSSSWARGQSWGLYGYTMAYRFTGDTSYLNHAKNIAEYLLTHQNLPDDNIPYWDYNAPDIPNEPRDASAGAIMGSALLELSTYCEGKNKKWFKEEASTIINSLSSSDYFANPDSGHYFILKHSVGSKPGNSEVNVPLVYADYYFLESLVRKKKLKNNKSLFKPLIQ